MVVLVIILVVAVIWRGPKTLPQIGNMLGRGVKEARKEMSDFQKERDGSSDQAPPTPPAASGN
jgi:TatA/E family protein of Tat protein translocase